MDSKDNNKESQLTSEHIKLLKNLNIQHIHTVPEQHKIEKTSRLLRPTREDKRRFEQFHVIKIGPFNNYESAMIKENWNTFCKLHNWDPHFPDPFIQAIDNKGEILSLKQKLSFAQFIAKDLPWRTLNQVYNKFKKLVDNTKIKKTARITKEENKIILKYMERESDTPKKLKEVCRILKRNQACVLKRYKELKINKYSKIKNKKRSKTKKTASVTWTFKLCNEFIKNLLELTLSTDVEELKNAIIPVCVWKELEEKMKIKHTVLKGYWCNQLHLQLFSPKPIIFDNIKIQLIEILYLMQVSGSKDINWTKVVDYIDGTTETYLSRMLSMLSTPVRRKLGTNDLRKKVKYLYQQKAPMLMKSDPEKFLKRLEYVNGKLKVVDNEDLVNQHIQMESENLSLTNNDHDDNDNSHDENSDDNNNDGND